MYDLGLFQRLRFPRRKLLDSEVIDEFIDDFQYLASRKGSLPVAFWWPELHLCVLECRACLIVLCKSFFFFFFLSVEIVQRFEF